MSKRFKPKHSDLAAFAKEIEQFARFRHCTREIFGEMVQVWTISMRNAFMPQDADWHEREREYHRLAEKYGTEGMTLMSDGLAALTAASMAGPGDHLGELYHAMNANSKGLGQFFTPYTVSSLMAAMTFSKDVVERHIAEKGYLLAQEPSCGAGGMVVAIGQALRDLGFEPTKVLRVHAVDIDRIAVGMTFIQSTLQAVPCFVEQADALNPASGDSYGYRFPNVHYARLVIAEYSEKEKCA